MFYEDTQQATADSWGIPFRGDSSSALIEIILETFADDKMSNLLPIVQSSGTGKSRTVDEMAKKVFTIPLTLREASDLTGYPYADADIVQFFNSYAASCFDRVKEAIATLLAEIFERTTEWVATVAQESIQGEPEMKYVEVACQWRSHIGNSDSKNRVSFYREIADTARNKLPESDTTSPVGTLFDAAKHLQDALRTTTGQDRPYIAIYFDEVYWLTQKVLAGTRDYSAYYVLCDLLSRLKTYGVFAIFLSTRLDISTLAPPSPWSFQNIKLHAPFVELPFDVYAEGPIITEGEMSLQEVCGLDFMVQFGRPLFWTRYEKGGCFVKQDIVTFAAQKLTRQMYPYRMPLLATFSYPQAKEACFAIFSTRLLLSFDPHRMETRRFEAGQVASHLRIAYSVPQRREYMQSGSSSEPIVAEAAAHLMNCHSTTEIIDAFCGLMDSDFIGKGERGELVARLLVTLAHDQAIRKGPRGYDNAYTHPLPVCKFLEALIATKYHDTVLTSRPQDGPHISGIPLQDAFKDAFVNFTHFIKAGDSSVLTTSAAWKALARANAWQCVHREEGVDIAIPIHFAGNDGKLCCDTSSCIFIQIKDKIDEPLVYIDPEEFGFFEDSTVMRPYIVITMELGVHSKVVTSASATAPEDVGCVEDDITTISGGGHRYDISIVGCSPEVYGVLTEADKAKDKLAKVLAYRDLFSEHPRQGETTLRLVRRMKPMFYMGHDSYDWAQDRNLSGKEPGVYVQRPPVTEGVYIGKRKSME